MLKSLKLSTRIAIWLSDLISIALIIYVIVSFGLIPSGIKVGAACLLLHNWMIVCVSILKISNWSMRKAIVSSVITDAAIVFYLIMIAGVTKEVILIGGVLLLMSALIISKKHDGKLKYEIEDALIYNDDTDSKDNEAIPNTTESQELAITIQDVDKMDGIEFEHFIAWLLKRHGYKDIRVTKGSGDQGADIIATDKDDILCCFQCKRYSGKVSNKAVQEIHAAKSLYGCHRAIVVTNSYFTESADKLSNAVNVELWNRFDLMNLIILANKMDSDENFY